MPDKDLTFWAGIIATLRDHGLIMMMTFIISYMRIQLYGNGRTWKAELLEATLGTIVIMMTAKGLQAMEINEGWSWGASIFIGLIGIDKAREFIERWANRRFGNG